MFHLWWYSTVSLQWRAQGGDRGGKPPPQRNFVGEILQINGKKIKTNFRNEIILFRSKLISFHKIQTKEIHSKILLSWLYSISLVNNPLNFPLHKFYIGEIVGGVHFTLKCHSMQLILQVSYSLPYIQVLFVIL